MTNTPTTESRLAVLERSNNRWRLAAIGASALLAGFFIGGMGQPAKPAEYTPKDVVGVAGTDEQIFRIHRDGSITYIKVQNGQRTANGLFDWGDVLIDHKYTNIDKR